jgi:hypothetical protein
MCVCGDSLALHTSHRKARSQYCNRPGHSAVVGKKKKKKEKKKNKK